MSEKELVQRVLGDWSTADLYALHQFNRESLAYWQGDEFFKGEDAEYGRNRHNRIFDLQRLNVAITIIIDNRRNFLIEQLGNFRMP